MLDGTFENVTLYLRMGWELVCCQGQKDEVVKMTLSANSLKLANTLCSQIVARTF